VIVNWRRLLRPKVFVEDGSVVEESFWSTLAMPLANVAAAEVEWIPYGPVAQLVLASKVGNTSRSR
jgi:hypothetical protein